VVKGQAELGEECCANDYCDEACFCEEEGEENEKARHSGHILITTESKSKTKSGDKIRGEMRGNKQGKSLARQMSADGRSLSVSLNFQWPC